MGFTWPMGVEGYLFPDEAKALYLLARDTQGDIVELGTYKGLSTICLAQGLRDRPEGSNNHVVWAVDHFAGENIEGVDLYLDYRKGTYRRALSQNLKSHRIQQLVTIVQNRSDAAARQLSRDLSDGVGLLFVDADHSADAARRDWNAWRPLLRPDGIAAFHDRGSGVGTVLEELPYLSDSLWEWSEGPGSLAIVSRRHAEAEVEV